MDISMSNIYCLSSYFNLYFSKYSLPFCKSLSAIIIGMMHSCSCSTGAIATSISAISGKSFIAADNQIRYFLSNINFQVDDKLWRCYQMIIFSFLAEGGYIKTNKKIFIQLDYTTLDNDFLILTASITFRGKAVPIYFTMRRYPKKKNITNLTKMETAFIKGLFHCLSKKYQYVIVADRGFGNERFMQLCIDNNFEYILRIKDNLNIEYGTKKKLKEIKYNKSCENVYVSSWDKTSNFIIKKQNDSTWYLCTNLSVLDRIVIVREYKRRFKIEKCFQDQKSSGFNIENTKIRKYDRLKRLLFCISLSQALMLFTGDILKHNHHSIKKTFPQSVEMILAFSILQKDISSTI